MTKEDNNSKKKPLKIEAVPLQDEMESVEEKEEKRPNVGELLKATRERLGEELKSIAEDLRIRYQYLCAIEESRYDDLPGVTYAIGFIKSYSEYLGLNGEEVVKLFKQETAKMQPQKMSEKPSSSPEKFFPVTNYAIIIAVVLFLSYLIWLIVKPSDNQMTEDEIVVEDVISENENVDKNQTTTEGLEQTDQDQTRLSEEGQEAAMLPMTTPLPPPVEEIQKTIMPEALPETAEPNPAPQEMIEEEKEELVEAVTETHVEPVQEEEKKSSFLELIPLKKAETTDGTTTEENPVTAEEEKPSEPAFTCPATQMEYGTSHVGSRIFIKGKETSWVQIVNAAGSVVFDKILCPGDTYYVPNEEGLLLTTGNAGGVEIVADGTEIPAFGPSGVKRSNIKMDVDSLKAGTAYLG